MKRLTFLFLVSFLALALTSEGARPREGKPKETSSSLSPVPQEDASSEPQEVSYMPGQILVRFEDAVSEGISVGAFDPAGSSFSTITGTSTLDQVVSTYVQGIIPLHKKFHEKIYIERKSHQELYLNLQNAFPERTAPSGVSLPPLEKYFIVRLKSEIDPKQAVAAFRKEPSVEGAWLDLIAQETLSPNDPYYQSSDSWGQGYEDMWALRRLSPEPAWDITRGEGVVVAVIDSGLDYLHEDMNDGTTVNVWTNPGEIPGDGIDNDENNYIDDVMGFDFVNSVDANGDGDYNDAGDTNDPDPMDDRVTGHGTHVAGTIAAIGNNGRGVVGVAYQSKIMPLKALDANGSGPVSKLSEAIRYAVDNGAAVINNSWGFETARVPNAPVLEDAVRYAYALGRVVVFSAGNRNDNVLYYSPQNMREVITVASTDYLDNRSSFSNFGSKIDVAAPGGDSSKDILSLKASSVPVGDPNIVGTYYLRKAGTSMAAPHVSGIAALLFSDPHPDRVGLTNEEVRHLIRAMAEDKLDPQADGSTLTGFDLYTGYGRVNAQNTLQSPPDEKAVATITSPRYQNVTGTIDILGTATASPSGTYSLRVAEGEVHPPFDASSWVPLGDPQPTPGGSSGGILYPGFDLSGLAKGEHTLSLDVATGGSLVARDTVLFNIPWPFKTYGRIRSSPAIADLDGDFTLEILIGSEDGKIYCLNRDGSEKWSFSTGGGVESAPAIADLDGDGLLEVFFGSKDRSFYALNSDGTLRWSFVVSDAILSSPAVVDIDQDGSDLEILFGADDQTLYCLRSDGTLRWSFVASDAILSSPAVVDIDNDGSSLEVLFTTFDGKVYCLDKNGSEVWSIQAGPRTLSSPAVADIDNDGSSLEILFGSYDKNLYCLNSDGSVRWMFPSGDWILSSPAVADIDNDGSSLEILFGSFDDPVDTETDSQLFCLNSDGTERWSYVAGGQVSSSSAITDLDGDGVLEILFGALDGTLTCLNENGGLSWNFSTGAGIHASPGIADLDGDGVSEIVFGSYNEKIYALDHTGGIFTPPGILGDRYTPSPWPMFRHDPGHTGVYKSETSTLVCGDVGGQTWPRGETYIVTCNLTVPEGMTLTIEPGVEVRFQGNTSLTVDGGLDAQGEEDAKILFTSNKQDPVVSDWGGIFVNGNATGSLIQHATVEYADIGIRLIANPFPSTVSHSVIRYNGRGIQVDPGYLGNPEIYNNDIIFNDYGLVAFMFEFYVSVWNNIIAYNTTYGAWNENPIYPPPDFHHNDVWNNGNSPDDDIVNFFPRPTEDISVDPRFVDAPNGDYHLKANSSCINAGDPASPNDPDGTRADIGMFYRHKTTGGPGCFLAGTPILLTNGTTLPIEQLKVGDILLAFDEATGELKEDKVKEFFQHEAEKYLIVNGHLKVTPNHPVYSEGNWIEIGKLKLGDHLLGSDGTPEMITSIQSVTEEAQVYNLEVNPYHTYIAGGVVVHNKPPPAKALNSL